MDLETGEYAEYPLPSQTNIRRVFVDNSTTPPTFWVGNNHHAAIVKLEPLESGCSRQIRRNDPGKRKVRQKAGATSIRQGLIPARTGARREARSCGWGRRRGRSPTA